MKKYPIALSIAGSDSGGGAGVQADIKTMSALGVYATTAITAITAQNTRGVTAVQGVDPGVVAKQIEAVFADLRPSAVKIGMLFSEEIVKVVASTLKKYMPIPIILDPVMISTSGSKLIDPDAVDAIIYDLFPLATVITPNRMEAEQIARIKIKDKEDITTAAMLIFQQGGEYVLIKGGHFGGKVMTDYLFKKEESDMITLDGPRVETNNTHGTGCTLSSAITAYIALGCSVERAIVNAKIFVQGAIEEGQDVKVGSGHGPLNHFFNPQKLKLL